MSRLISIRRFTEIFMSLHQVDTQILQWGQVGVQAQTVKIAEFSVFLIHNHLPLTLMVKQLAFLHRYRLRVFAQLIQCMV